MRTKLCIEPRNRVMQVLGKRWKSFISVRVAVPQSPGLEHLLAIGRARAIYGFRTKIMLLSGPPGISSHRTLKARDSSAQNEMRHYLATRCTKCFKWVPIRECDAEDPTFDPSILIQFVCPHCGTTFKLQAKALEVVPEVRLQAKAK